MNDAPPRFAVFFFEAAFFAPPFLAAFFAPPFLAAPFFAPFFAAILSPGRWNGLGCSSEGRRFPYENRSAFEGEKYVALSETQ